MFKSRPTLKKIFLLKKLSENLDTIDLEWKGTIESPETDKEKIDQLSEIIEIMKEMETDLEVEMKTETKREVKEINGMRKKKELINMRSMIDMIGMKEMTDMIGMINSIEKIEETEIPIEKDLKLNGERLLLLNLERIT